MNNTNNPALGIGVSGMSVSGKAIIGVPTQGRSQADKTRAGHSQLSYSCSAGGASVNLFNGSMIFSRPTISLGANTYAIGASHVYNNSIIGNMPFNTHMGNGWKLDVQQYLFSEGNNQFFYIDSGGTKHIFEPTGLNNHFYDTSGLGLILRLHVNGEHIIEDDYNNRLFFNIQGFLVRVASSHGVTKNYEYINGRLMSIFDSRRTGNNNRIRFAYENDLLATVTASGQTIRFHYNRDNLERIERQVDNLIENVAFFRYAGNQMTRVACPKDFTSLGFTYNNHQRVSLVKEDIVNGIGQGNNFNIGNVVSTLEQNDFAYELSDSRVIRTTVTNRNNIRVAYHFNQKGFTTSVLEVSNNNLNDLRTMEKEPGPILVGPGPDAERINGRNANPIATNHTFIINAGIDGSAIRNYVFNKCRNYRYFNVGFWLKVVSGDIQNSRVRVDVLSMTGNGDSSNTSNHRRYNNEVTFDNTAVGAWQYVSVPIYIAEANLRELRLSFLDNNASRNIKVAEVRLCYDTRSRIVLGTSNEGGAYLDNVTHVAGLPGGNRNITDDFYLTEKDLQSTLYSRFRAEIASPQGTHYFFSHNDGTRKIALTRATNINLMAPSRTLPSVIIHPLILNIDNRTTYFQETISPDGNLVVRGIPHFIRARTGAVSNANNNFNRIELYVRAWRGNTTSNTVSVVDMFGDLRSEVDEYGVRTRYSYDNFGNLSAKEIVAPCAITCASTQHGGACNCNAEVLRFNVSNTDTNSVITGRSGANQGATNLQTSTQLNYDAFGNVASSSFRGSSELTSAALTTTSIFDRFSDRITQIHNSMSGDSRGSNHIRYNNRGLVESVTPTGWGNPSENTSNYGYGFAYNNRNELSEVTLMDGENSNQTRLVNKLVDRDNGTVTTMQRRSSTEIDTATVLFDDYGRTVSIAENNDTTARFGRQDEAAINGASEGASEVTWMVDNLEDRVYHYTYDDFNNCTGYRRRLRNADGSNGDWDFGVERRGNNGDTTVTYNRGISGRERRSETIYDDNNALLSPRIRRTNDNVATLNENHQRNVIYSYDNLGRIGSKQVHLGHRTDIGHSLFAENRYVRGTLLKESVNLTARYGRFNRSFSHNYRYDQRGRIKSIRGDNLAIDQFTYDNANRLRTERLANGSVREYIYNKDGSIASERIGSGAAVYNKYDKGRLTEQGNFSYRYDDLGNCTSFNGIPLSYSRGSLLQRVGEGVGNAIYNYNSQGVRTSKITTRAGIVTTNYFHDGDKLIEENRGGIRIRYMYDTEGIMGFSIGSIDYNFVKDAEGSVRSILRSDMTVAGTPWGRENVIVEIARYEYDAWGNTTVIHINDHPTGEHRINGITVADFNPIRWKSQYFDCESGFYAMSGGSGTRYYSPQMRQFISPENYEGMMMNAGLLYGLNPYLLCVDNPVNLSYNGHTIATNGELAFEPNELTSRQMRWFRIGRFFRTPEGQALAAKLFVLAIVLVIVTKGILAAAIFAGMSRASLVVGGAMAGMRARDSGGCFNEGFTDHINDNWAMSMAISSVLVIGMVGVGLAIGGIAGAVASKKGGAIGGVAGASKSGLPNAAKLAKKYTHNKRSKVVVLGKHDGGASTGYIAVAQKHKATYFSMPDELWNQLFTAHGESFMWSINEAFLTQQMAKGKIFMASHSMVNPTGAFAREILFLQNNTIAIIPI